MLFDKKDMKTYNIIKLLFEKDIIYELKLYLGRGCYMKGKFTLLIIPLIIFSLNGCTNRELNNQDDNIIGQRPPENEQRAGVVISDLDRSNADENINGFKISDDERLTDIAQGEVKNILSQFSSQSLRSQIINTDNTTILENYESVLPSGINNTVQYSYYDMGYNYLLVTNENGFEVRENPSINGKVIGNLGYLDKVSLRQSVQGDVFNDSDIWYRILFLNGNDISSGYIHSSAGIARSFKFQEMQSAVNELIQELAQGKLHYISNYKNYNGAPPNKNNAQIDEFGYRSYHSAPAYTEANSNSDFRYIPDGILVRILDETGDFYYINVPTFKSNYYVPKQYINRENTFNTLRHVVVVDRNQQNQASFEVAENGLNLVSYTFSTTGLPGQDSYETTLGSYKAIEKKDRFLYLGNGTQEIAGYAPYAIRFTGGAYIHGVPVQFIEKNGEKVDPGKAEYLHTIGTFPRSSMCVRNYTSHAEFLYNWMDIENGAVIVIE